MSTRSQVSSLLEELKEKKIIQANIQIDYDRYSGYRLVAVNSENGGLSNLSGDRKTAKEILAFLEGAKFSYIYVYVE
jgi:hypothetical protein